MADTGVRPTEGDVKQMDRFLTLKANRSATTRPPAGSRSTPNIARRSNCRFPKINWQRTLLESARRGEHIVRFDGERTAIAQARSVV